MFLSHPPFCCGVLIMVFHTTPTARCLRIHFCCRSLACAAQTRYAPGMINTDISAQVLQLAWRQKIGRKAKKNKKNRPNNKVVSSSNLLSDKYGARDTLNFHYVALFSSKRLSRTFERTHILHDCTRSQAYSRLMVNAWNVTVPYQTARSLVVERISFMRAVGAIFQKKIWDENNQGSLCNIHVLSTKKK